jgi:molybdenum cofactor cytidylyltransferase
MNEQKIVGILLAAGMGRRFDASGVKNKLLQIVGNGQNLAQSAASHLSQAVSGVIAVVNASSHGSTLSTALQASGCRVVVCPNASAGMARSLVFGLTQLPFDCEGVVIALADMPSLHPETIVAVVNGLRAGAEIVVPTYAGKRGHPVGFARCHFAELMRLQGDQGARSLLQQYPVQELAVNDPGVLHDIDTPDDLGRSAGN